MFKLDLILAGVNLTPVWQLRVKLKLYASKGCRRDSRKHASTRVTIRYIRIPRSSTSLRVGQCREVRVMNKVWVLSFWFKQLWTNLTKRK